MIRPASPALRAFLQQLGETGTLAQVAIRKEGPGYELRHESDRDLPSGALKPTTVGELRVLAQTTEQGHFRPLKSAPNLARGWRGLARNDAELEDALQRLYPGALADALAARQEAPPVTNFREYTQRQTGMYRVTTLLSDEQAGLVVESCCHAQFCLKHRLWLAPLAPPDPAGSKSAIPCLEPCALLLEWARKVARMEQEDKTTLELGTSEWATILEVARSGKGTGLGPGEREADFGAARNPRRVQWVLAKLEANAARLRGPTAKEGKEGSTTE